MADTERWVEVWRGSDPAIAGRAMESAGIEMRIASAGWGAHGGGLGILSLLRKHGQSKLLVREADRERARAALK
ncbi:MAG: hypothetical protein R3B97_03870 [Dehalococcoidia bacterium]|nr:hypothetical protein [Dehalococcoidia bacterium]MCB9485547.1 hypothetical protein [Thermoflexaceae bacterium]